MPKNRPVSGGSKRAHSLSPPGHLFPLKGDRAHLCASSPVQTLTLEGWGWGVSRGVRSSFPDKVEHSIPPSSPKTHPEIIFTPVPKLLVNRCFCATTSQISAVSEQVCGQQPTRGYDLKCRKDLFYIEGRSKGEKAGEGRGGMGGGRLWLRLAS